MNMRIFNGFAGILIGIAAAAGAAAAEAKVLTFHVALDGKYGVEPSGSAATGKARIKVDTDRKRVSVDLTVDGITQEALWDKLVAAPIGPIHFHKYAVAGGHDAVLVLPLPYGADYHATKKGLRVDMRNYDYAAGTKLVGSSLGFDDFVAALRSGLVVLNVHTDAFNAGEISGKVIEG
jgi:hypothetical protein